ncbi:MAG: hypothetical protein IH600_02360 [Bacteroidetes bacterium]|nr:hypothetical protein [Bacteroidota bacterium]
MGESRKKIKARGNPQVRENGSWIAALPFLAIALLRIGAAFVPEARVWGLHALAYLPLWAAVLLGAAGLLFATPLLYRIFSWKARTFLAVSSTAPAWLWPVLMAVIAGALFWVFRMQTYFLGDGAVYLAEIYRYTSGLPYVHDVLFSTWSAPLTGAGIATLAMYLSKSVTEPGSLMAYTQSAFWLSGLVAGMAYILLSFTAARRMFRDAELRFGFLILLLFTPGVLFFFGYVEYYTLFFTTGLAYFLTLTLAVRGQISVAWPAAAFVLMCAFHLMGVLALPSLLLLVVLRFGGDAGRRLLKPAVVFSAIGAVLIAAGVYYFASGIAWDGSRVALALQPFGSEGAVQQYTLLSGWHLVDVLNLLFLLAAPVVPLLFFLPLREKLRDTEMLIAITNLVFFSFLLFFGYTCFGMARDWDVNTLWAVALLFVFAAAMRDVRPDAWRYRMYLAAGAAMTALLPWIAVNVTTDASVTRFRQIMALDDRHLTGDFALNGYEHLRKYYRSVGDVEGTLWAIRKKIEMVGYQSDYSAYLTEALKLQDGVKMREAFDFATSQLRTRLGEMERRGVDTLYAGHRSALLERYYECVLESHFRSSTPGFSAAYVDDHIAWLRERASGEPLFRLVESRINADRHGTEMPLALVEAAAREFYGSPTLALGIAAVLSHSGQFADAVDVLQRSFTRNPETSLLALYLAETELKMQPQRLTDAEAHLRAVLANPEGVTIQNEGERARLLQWAADMLKRIEESRGE